MADRRRKTVLFLDTGNHHRSRAAEAVFNSVAGKMGLPWQATSRGLAAEASAADLEQADRVVAAHRGEHLPLLRERFPEWAEKVEYWEVEGDARAPAVIEREVMGLVARIMGGGERQEALAEEEATPALPPREPARKPVTVRVGRETAGRRGKGVTTVYDLPLDEAGMKELAATLKQRCGTGGTVKGGRIEIQGDIRERVAAELERLGYKVKRTGG